MMKNEAIIGQVSKIMYIREGMVEGEAGKFIACIVIGNSFELRRKIQVDGAAFVVYHHVRSPSFRISSVSAATESRVSLT